MKDYTLVGKIVNFGVALEVNVHTGESAEVVRFFGVPTLGVGQTVRLLWAATLHALPRLSRTVAAATVATATANEATTAVSELMITYPKSIIKEADELAAAIDALGT